MAHSRPNSPECWTGITCHGAPFLTKLVWSVRPKDLRTLSEVRAWEKLLAEDELSITELYEILLRSTEFDSVELSIPPGLFRYCRDREDRMMILRSNVKSLESLLASRIQAHKPFEEHEIPEDPYQIGTFLVQNK